MRASLEFTVWTIVVFSCLFEISQAQCNATSCNNSVPFNTTTTTITEQNCSLSDQGSIHDLLPGAVYTVFSHCFNCCFEATTKPEKVVNLTAQSTTTSLSLSWTKPHGNVSEYNVSWSGGGRSGDMNTSQSSAEIHNLTSGVEYTVSVTAVAEDGQTEGMEVTVSQYTIPAKPVNITASHRETNSLNISWTLPEGNADHYIVQLDQRENQTNASSLWFTDLTPGHLHTVSVTAVAGHLNNTSEPSTFATYPLPPESIKVINRTNSSLELRWDVDRQMDLLSINYSIAYDGGGSNLRTSTVNEITLTSLNPGTQYEIMVTTIGPENLRSSGVNISACTNPNPVLDLTAYPESNTSVKVEWSHPQDHNKDYSYLILVYDTRGNIADNQSVQRNNTFVTGLDPGTRYNITVTTLFTSDCKSTEEEVSSYTKPNPVSSLQVQFVNTSSITLIWSNSTDYKLEYSYLVQARQGPTVAHDNSTAKQSYTFTGLTPGELYTFAVVTEVAGVRSDEETITEQMKPAVATITEITGSTTHLAVSWSKAEGRVDAYTVLLYNDTHQVDIKRDLSNSTRATSFSDLTPGALYCAEVVTKSGPLENKSFKLCNATFPNPPRNIRVTSQTERTLTFTWDAPEDMQPDQYNFSVTTYSGTEETQNSFLTLNKLESGSPYEISVVTVGVKSYESQEVRKQAYTRPYSVTHLRQTEITPDSITLVWNQTDHKSDYTYFIEVRNISGVVNSTNVTESTHEAEGLISGNDYSFTVTTRAADGTPATPQSVSYFTRPYSVKALVADTINTTSINLTWVEPEQYKEEYTYLVETSGCTDPQNHTKQNETVEISGLTPGTNCSFCVTVRAADGTEGESTCTSQYTKPEKAQPLLCSHGSNSSLVVSWAKPLGDVEFYAVYLNGSETNLTSGKLNSSSQFHTFGDLPAGRLYTVTVETQSGPFRVPSESVANATYPNPPGAIIVLNKTTGSIHISWEEAPLMRGAHFYYRLEIPSKQVDNTTLTNYAFERLLSGTSYNLSVTTVAAMGFESEAVWHNMVTTRPFSVRALRADPHEERVTLSWSKPVEYKSTYRFSVTLMSSNGGLLRNETTQLANASFSQLDPGSFYRFTVTTETSDGTQGAPEETSDCTDASAVEFLECSAPNEQNAKITWFWKKPKGNFSEFTVKLQDSQEEVHKGCCEFEKSSLKHFTNYTLGVTTQSCGNPSVAVRKECQTGITKPPVPKNYKSLISLVDVEHNTFSVKIDPRLLDPTKGPIKNVGVLLTEHANVVDPSKMAQYLETTYDQWKEKKTEVYLATVIDALDSDVNGKKRRSLDPLTIHVGDETTWNGYLNGLLEPTERYKFAVVLFTDLKIKSKVISGQESLFSVTEFELFVKLPENPVVIGLAVGLTLGIFCVLLIILIVSITYWRRLSSKESSDTQRDHMRAKVSAPVRVEEYEVYYKKQKADSNCGFAAEYEELKVVGTGQSKTNAMTPENKSKNRYHNVLPYDSSRVKLSIISGNPLDDYINANYIPGYNSRKEFIAAQGPLPSTVKDFWRMIWEKNVHTMVMLTRCNEQGRVKCEQYWTPGTKHFGNITVTATAEIPLDDWTIRDFNVKNVKTAETRSVRHFHFTAWPDHGVPETTELLISFRHLVREHMDQYRHSPTVVHCSAGVGRTGTFIAIDRLIFQIERENVVDVYGIVHDMRMHRTLMVQTEDQYVFLNQCALDIIRSRTGTNVDLIYQNTTALSIYENIELQRR